MTGFVYCGYIYEYDWSSNTYTKRAQRKNGVTRIIGESEYNCMKVAFEVEARRKIKRG